jgi:hypothetical protein
MAKDQKEAPQVEAEIELQTDAGKKVIREKVPRGFPKDLVPHLVEFWRRGYGYAKGEEVLPSLVEFAPSPRGRRASGEVAREAREALKLLGENRSLSYRQIAIKVCRNRCKADHRCNKRCADRIRRAVADCRSRDELNRIAKGEA